MIFLIKSKVLKKNNSLRFVANFIGFMGLLPFFICTFGVWFFPTELKPSIENAFLIYLSSITSFLAAIYWGIAIIDTNNKNVHIILISSVIPLIIVFLINILDLNTTIKLSLFILIINIILLLEVLYRKTTKVPYWYLNLRITLNLILNILIVLFIFNLKF